MASRQDVAVTVEEKVLLHLSQYLVSGDDYEAPFDVTQEGIAEAIAISPTHVPRAVNALRKKDFLLEQKMHVPGGDRRRKSYRLTHEGYQRAYAIRERLLAGTVLVRGDDGGIQETRLADLLGPKAPVGQILDVLNNAEQLPLVTTLRRRTPRREPHSAIFSRIPSVGSFVGRKEELKALTEALKDHDVRLIAISGVAGIGKTTLVAKVLEKFRPRDHVFWYRLHEWETLRNLGFVMGDFLGAIGHPALKDYMESHEEHDAVAAYKMLTEEFSDVEAVVVLDDFDKAPPIVTNFVETLLPHLENFPGVTFIAITRSVTPIFSESDLLEGRVVEIVLEGLDERSAKQLLKEAKLEDEVLQGLLKLTGGHPLLLRLMEGIAESGELAQLVGASAAGTGEAAAAKAGRGAGPAEPAAGKAGRGSAFDAEPEVGRELGRELLFSERVGRFITKEILAALSDRERSALEAASVHRYPFPAEALFADDELDFDVVDSLRSKILLKQVGGRYVEVADFVREFVYARLPPPKKHEHHLRAAEALARQGETVALWEVPYHLARGGRVQEAAAKALENGQVLLEDGKLEEITQLLKEFPEGGVDDATWREMAALRATIYRRWGDETKASFWDDEAKMKRPAGGASETRQA